MNFIQKPAPIPKIKPKKIISAVSCKECKYSILDADGTRLCRILKFNKDPKKYIPADLARKSEKMCGPHGLYFTQIDVFYPDYLTIDEYY